MTFSTSDAAKEFLISRIEAEASRQQIPLSEVERKMLYFSKTSSTLPDMAEIARRFNSECNRRDYERKILRLSRSAYSNDRKESPETWRLWFDAVNTLKNEDHYILGLTTLPASWGCVRKLISFALIGTALGLLGDLGLKWLRQQPYGRIPDFVQVSVLALFLVFIFVLGSSYKARQMARQFGDSLMKLIARLFLRL